MLGRFCLRALLLVSLAVPFIGCGSSTDVDSISVSPTTISLVPGATVQLTATATIGHGSHPAGTQNVTSTVTWASSIAGVATVSPAGVVTGVGAGTTTITASMPGFGGVITSNEASVTVAATTASEPLASLAISPTTQTANAVGETAQFIAIATTGSGATVNLTNQSIIINGARIPAAKWSSSDSSVATINPATGVATAVGAGTTTITAIGTNPDGSVVTGTAKFVVVIPNAPEPLVSLAIVPTAQTATVAGQTAQFIAIGTTASGTTINLTNKLATIGGVTIGAAVWSSSSTSVATITNTGLATAVNTGVAAITALAYNPDGTVVTGTATFTVNTSGIQEPLLSLAIVPSSQTVQFPGQTGQLLAIGTFSATPFTQNLTSNNTTYPIRWQSSDASVATVGSPEIPGTTPGLVTATGQGTASITAYAANTDGTLVYAIANFTVLGGTPEPFTALTISPGSQSLSATGQTGQFIAIGTAGDTGLLKDVSNSSQVAWTSSIPSIATVSTYPTSPAGVVTGVSPGTTTITATLTNPDKSVVTATANITVTASAAPEPLLSITVMPATVTIGNLDGTAQFLAFGTFSTAPTIQDITNGINRPGFTSATTWLSLPNPAIFPIETGGAPGETGGLITAYGNGTADVIAEATNPDGTVVYSQAALFNCPLVLASTDPQTGAITPGSCNPDTVASPLLVTLTVFNAGLNQTGWLITAPSATGTPDVIHCGPNPSNTGGSVCAATYPVGTTVILTAPKETGVNFGGWSSDCVGNPVVPDPNVTNTCTVTLGSVGENTSNVSVGAIFN